MSAKPLARIHTDGSLRIDVDTADHFTVVYDADCEIPVVKIENSVWVEEPKYLTFVGVGRDRLTQISELIEALEKLTKELQS